MIWCDPTVRSLKKHQPWWHGWIAPWPPHTKWRPWWRPPAREMWRSGFPSDKRWGKQQQHRAANCPLSAIKNWTPTSPATNHWYFDGFSPFTEGIQRQYVVVSASNGGDIHNWTAPDDSRRDSGAIWCNLYIQKTAGLDWPIFPQPCAVSQPRRSSFGRWRCSCVTSGKLQWLAVARNFRRDDQKNIGNTWECIWYMQWWIVKYSCGGEYCYQSLLKLKSYYDQ